MGNDNGNNLLEMNEKFQVTIGDPIPGAAGGNLVNALEPDLGANTAFTLELLTPAGAVLQIPRNTPATIDAIMNLH
jgi:archaellin